MGKMSWISYLCENNKRNELVMEVAGLAEGMNKTAEEVADGFLDAHRNMRQQKNNPVFKKLNEIHDEMMKEVEKEKECVICHGEIVPDPVSGWEHGCNAQPVAEGQCCKECDDNIVLPARISEYVTKVDNSLSQCCGAKIIYHDICSSCKEHI